MTCGTPSCWVPCRLPDCEYSRSRFQIPVVVAARRITYFVRKGALFASTVTRQLRVWSQHPTGNFEELETAQHERGVQAPSITSPKYSAAPACSTPTGYPLPATCNLCLSGSRA
ncbi:hypothetical protein TgHK011_006059 [Trichoderma gracile]|nr:hypothetical protein TgHK011_006059 [Trichoderma gracile]